MTIAEGSNGCSIVETAGRITPEARQPSLPDARRSLRVGQTIIRLKRGSHPVAVRNRQVVYSAVRATRGRVLHGCKVVALVMLLVLTAQMRPSKAAIWPVRLWGELGYDYRVEDLERQQHIGRVTVRAATFISQPWIAQVHGSVGLVVRDTERETGKTTGDIIEGDVSLRLFPRSRFPLEVFFQKVDSTTETNLTGLDRELTRYGFEQRYKTDLGHQFRARYEHTDQTFRTEVDREDDDPERQRDRDISDLLQLGYSFTIREHRIDATLDWQDIDRKGTGDDVERLLGNVVHRYRRGRDYSVENRLTYGDMETQLEQLLDTEFKTTTSSLEYTSYAFWRPQTQKPTLVNGTVRLVDSSSKSGAFTTDVQSYLLSAGVTHDWSPRWRFFGAGSVLYNTGDIRSQDSVFLNAGATYSSEIMQLGRYNYSWYAGPEVSTVMDDDGSFQSLAFDAGHTINRNIVFEDRSNLSLTGRQNATLIEDTEGRSTQTLRHNVSIAWIRPQRARTTSVRLSASDSRTFGGGGRVGDEDREFQLVNLQLTLNQNLTRASSLNGNATFQLTRSVVGRLDDDDDLNPSASINITYNHRQVLGVPRLVFRSTLRAFSDSYFPFLDDPQDLNDREALIWENELNYAIGRLFLTLFGSISESNVNDESVILFQVRRFFGDL